MRNYTVTITETLSKNVTVKAKNFKDAKETVERMYDNAEVTLDWNDFDSVEFTDEHN